MDDGNWRKEHSMRLRNLVLAAVATSLAAFLPALHGDEQTGKEGAVALFNGTDLTGWKLRGKDDKAKAKSKWVVGRCELDEMNPTKLKVTPISPQAEGGPAARMLINSASGVDLISEKLFRDCQVEVEFMI